MARIDCQISPTAPKFVTKYVSKDFFDDTAAGCLRFGTLQEYRSAEQKDVKRFSDITEGCYVTKVADDILGEDVNIPGILAKGMFSMGNRGSSIAIEQVYDALVLCVVSGNYCSKHHFDFVRNNNDDADCYVTFNTEKLYLAMLNMFSNLTYGNTLFSARDINYITSNKEEIVDLAHLHNIANNPGTNEFNRAVFIKPDFFSYEKEFRFTLWPGDADIDLARDSLIVKNHSSKKIMLMFKESVVDSGYLI